MNLSWYRLQIIELQST